MESKKHWFIRYLPLWVLMVMVAIPATSVWTHGKVIEAQNQAKKEREQQAQEVQQLYLTGQSRDLNAQMSSLIGDISKGDWTSVPSEWRDAAHKVFGTEGASRIRQALQERPPTKEEISSLIDQVLKD